ncbi:MULTISPECIES: hypothetical protein [unclassified Wolbachia]
MFTINFAGSQCLGTGMTGEGVTWMTGERATWMTGEGATWMTPFW